MRRLGESNKAESIYLTDVPESWRYQINGFTYPPDCTMALTFKWLCNQEDFQKLVLDSQVLADVSLVDAWHFIEAAIKILEEN